jgi:mono/diheme cytochrome c family protein
MKILKPGLVFLTFSLLLWACSGGSGNQPVNNPASNATPIDPMAAGRKIYNQNCAACHKVSGTGGKMEFNGKTIDPEDLTSEKIKNTPDDKLYGYIISGFPDDGMPAFKDKLKEPEIREVVRYIRAEIQKMK